MNKLDPATRDLPQGRSNRVYKWMLAEMAYLKGIDAPLPTATELAESAADAFAKEHWLDDETHWIWDAAAIVCDEMNPARD